ncbi:ATP-binding protein [Streptomyces sp. RPT161]|uniref:ATP-binding protein n=1 Tax=Streptomyces sp. RPT161 TaxID=3015993 RepID=UPI0022B92599|nr:ATP-binding protein [Streptomyces sp. RPT161]
MNDVERRFPRHSRSVGRARKWLRQQVGSWAIPDETAQTALLLLSELMTNACRHARVPPGRQIGVRCVRTADTLRIEVSDANNDWPRPRQASARDCSGRGLTLVAILASAWAVQPRPYGIGKTVWFELPVRSR